MTLRDFSPEVLAELREIWSYIAEDNSEAADQLEEEIFQACHRLARNPYLGHIRPDLTDKPVRFWPVHRNYLIVYRISDSTLDIVHVFHAARDIRSELEEMD